MRISHCVQFLPFQEQQFTEGGQTRASYTCVIWSGFILGLVECAIVKAGLDMRPVVLPADMELCPVLSLTLEFLPLSKSYLCCHCRERLKLSILNLTDDSAKRFFLIKLYTVICRDKRVNRANQEWLADKEPRYCLMLLLFVRIRIRYVWGYFIFFFITVTTMFLHRQYVYEMTSNDIVEWGIGQVR